MGAEASVGRAAVRAEAGTGSEQGEEGRSQAVQATNRRVTPWIGRASGGEHEVWGLRRGGGSWDGCVWSSACWGAL
eukprot:scaffold15305_cov116-Isochrysis_galbana.AAC.5